MVVDDAFCIVISALSTDYLCQDKAIFLNKQLSIFREVFASRNGKKINNKMDT